MAPQEEHPKPNGWAMRLMGLMAENLHLRSDGLNRAYRDCIKVLMDEIAQTKRHKLRLASAPSIQRLQKRPR